MRWEADSVGEFAAQISWSDGGIMVSIAAFQAVDPGSIPGHRIIFYQVRRSYN